MSREWLAMVTGSLMLAACSSTSSNGIDGGSDARGEASQPVDAGVGLPCGKLLSCDQACSGSGCTDGCYAEATGYAQGVFNALTACIDRSCPSTDGGPCASSSSSQCSSCNTSAATGPCVAVLLTCETDKRTGPPDPDGGGVIGYDGGSVMDSGPRISCGALVGCQVACAPGDTGCAKACFNQGTSTAQALDDALDNCVSTACPSAGGGPCTTPGTTCSGCEDKADYGTCGTQFSACQDDVSASSDAGTQPVALHGGTIHTLLSDLDQPQVVIVQKGRAYTSEVASAGPVLAVPVDGGAPSTISASQPFPMGLALDAKNAYVWNSGTFPSSGVLNNGDGTVVQIALAGGATTTLGSRMTVAYQAPYLNAIAHDATRVYWVTGGPGTPGAIEVAPIGGGTKAATLYGGQSFPEAVVTDGKDLYWSNWGTFDSGGNYNNDGAILKAPVAGGSVPVTLASLQSAPAALALDSANVYWTNIGHLTSSPLPVPSTGSVMQVALAGGSPVTLASKQNIPLGIAVSGGTVYWAEFTLSSPGNILSVPVGGGTATTLVTNVKDPFGIAVAGTTLYWTDNVPTGTHTGALLDLTMP